MRRNEIGPYTILKVCGGGGFANVFKVRHTQYGNIRALKILNQPVESEDDPKYKTFLQECSLLLKIGNGCHPNIIRIYQPLLIGNQALVEMDYVQGQTLNKLVGKTHFVPLEEIYTFINDIVGAMAFCHEDIYQFLMDREADNLQSDPNDAQRLLIDDKKRNELIANYRVVHNDLHSDNIMRRDYDGHYVLLDFGLAIQKGKCVKSSSRRDGALEYQSPEKLDDPKPNDPVDASKLPQSDVYSLGILMFEILAGRVPFPLKDDSIPSLNHVRNAHLHQDPPSIEPLRCAAFETAHPGKTYQRDYPEWLEQMIRKCLEKDWHKRYPDAKAVLNDFKAHLREDEANRNTQVTTAANDKLKEIAAAKDEVKKITAVNDELKKTTEVLQKKEELLQEEKRKLSQELQKANDQNEWLQKKIKSLSSIKTVPATRQSWLDKYGIYVIAALVGIVLTLTGYIASSQSDSEEQTPQTELTDRHSW
ncbi:MAG: protein kinase [Prevotella sp.]|nr:protein kinase [Prevotella sp.]